MSTEQYLITVTYGSKVWQLPVRIACQGSFFKISVDIEGMEVCFARDDHDGLRPLNHQDDFDPQFLYLVGKEVLRQRPVYNLN